MNDPFDIRLDLLQTPLTSGYAVIPSDTEDLPAVSRGVYLGTAGDISVVMKDGSSLVWKNLAAGIVYPFRVSRILATGTTAADIVVGW